MKRKTGLLMTALFVAAATLAVISLRSWTPRTWLVQRLQTELSASGDQQREIAARQLTLLDADGWHALLRTQQAKSGPPRVTARTALRQLLESWRALPQAASAKNISRFAAVLAVHAEQADKDSLCFCADLAAKLVEWPPSEVDETDRILCCERVIKRARQVGWPLPNVEVDVEENLATSPAKVPAAPGHKLAVTAANGADDSIDVPPDGDLNALPDPHADATQQPSPPAGDLDSTPETDAAEVVLSTSPAPMTVANRPRTIARGSLSDSESETSAELSVADSESENRPRELIAVDASPVLEPTWTELPIAEVIRALARGGDSAAATEELKRRGFDEANLRVAHAAADPDADKRLAVVRMLPELTGIDPVAWLIHFAHDDSPQVRAAAIRLLSTAGDSRIRPHLQKLEEQELDAEVRAALQDARKRFR